METEIQSYKINFALKINLLLNSLTMDYVYSEETNVM